MLTNFDIEKKAKQMDLPIVGVFSKDDMPKQREVGSYYVNLQNKNDGDGTHWCLAKIYCDEDREENKVRVEGDKICNALWFDPFGLDMPKEIRAFLSPFKPVAYNNRQIQSVATSQCGWYCLYCDYVLENHSLGDTYLETFEKFIASWSKDPVKNRNLLKERLKKI
jgi:hypothetical protein